MQPLVNSRLGQAAAKEVALWGKLESLGSLKKMRMKLDGWKRKGYVRAALGASMVKKRGVHVLLAMGLVLLVAAFILLMHLRDFSSRLGTESTARLPGTIDEEYYFQCDRSQFRSNICNLRGDIRLLSHNKTKSFVLYTPNSLPPRTETLKPYTRKWEIGSMSSVNELSLRTQIATSPRRNCDVLHTVPGVIFSTAGYTGNLYHEFNDGLIPLWISTQHLNREVVVVISSYHDWWYTKYSDVMAQMTKYEIVDLEEDKRVHCFPEIEAGLHIHGELAVNPKRMPQMETIRGFREVLNRAYIPGPIQGQLQEPKLDKLKASMPRLTIILRKKTRKFLNLRKIVDLAQKLGYRVSLLSPGPSTELKKIFRLLNQTDVLLGVHGAAMTHFLFMRPGTVFIQVVPLGTDWAANEYYGEPAVKLGLHYMTYKITPKESSLSDAYVATDPVLVDPESITQQGWETLKRIYLEGQDVRLSLRRVREVLLEAKAVLLAHCEKNYRGIWKTQGRDTEKASCVSSRLLDMCIVTGDLTDTLRVLKLHSEVFQVQKYDSNGHPSHKAPWFIGLRNKFVCKSIACAVHTHGWTACGEAVLLLLQKDRLIAEGEYYAQFAVELQQLGHPKEALLIATKTMKLVLGSERAQCHSQLLSSVVKMLCISEKCLQELSIEFTMWLTEMDITWIIQVLNELSTSMLKGSIDEQRIAVKQDSGIFRLFLTFFDILVARDFHSPVPEGLVVDLVHRFISLGDSKVLDSLMRPLLRQADLHPEQHCLKELLASDLLWNALVVDARGKDTLRALLERRLAWLTSSQMPEFNWCQPFAQLPQHPTIEEYLRGPARSLTYQFVSGLPEARKLALLFDGQYHNGYCATGTEGGRGAGAYCVIKKSRVAFEHVLNHGGQEQIEKKKLEEKLQIIRELCDGPGASVKHERVKERDEIQAAEEAGVKRQRVNEEKE